jgi:ATP-dependent Clp protease ATP-binding subunit ClpC
MPGYNFSDDVRRALQRAREQAAALHHGHVAPEHLLLGLTRGPGDTCGAVLNDLHVDPDDLFQRMLAATTTPVESEAAGPDLPYTESAKKVLELAMIEARDLKYGYVGTEHFLLGLLREGSSSAAVVLAGAGLTLAGTRSALTRLVAPSEPRDAEPVIGRRALLVASCALVVAIVALVLAIRAQP